MLQARVEEVIKEYNQELEASEEEMKRMRTIVIDEAKSVIAKLEEAEARRKEELGRRMNELIEKLSGDLEVMSVSMSQCIAFIFFCRRWGSRKRN